jgi:hypothetical protein
VAEVKVTVIDNRVNVIPQQIDAKVILGYSGPQGPRGSQILSGATDPAPNIGLIGDQYINTDTGKLFGPKTTSGWGEGVYLGNNDPNDLGQVYVQVSPSDVWNIIHTLEFVPNIIVVDSEGNVIEGDYEYLDDKQITATFSNSITGKAYLS